MGRTYLEKKKKKLKKSKKKYWRAKRALKRIICVFLFLFGRDLVKGQLLKGNFWQIYITKIVCPCVNTCSAETL